VRVTRGEIGQEASIRGGGIKIKSPPSIRKEISSCLKDEKRVLLTSQGESEKGERGLSSPRKGIEPEE